jgi:hypothetical protein
MLRRSAVALFHSPCWLIDRQELLTPHHTRARRVVGMTLAGTHKPERFPRIVFNSSRGWSLGQALVSSPGSRKRHRTTYKTIICRSMLETAKRLVISTTRDVTHDRPQDRAGNAASVSSRNLFKDVRHPTSSAGHCPTDKEHRSYRAAARGRRGGPRGMGQAGAKPGWSPACRRWRCRGELNGVTRAASRHRLGRRSRRRWLTGWRRPHDVLIARSRFQAVR